ncbi:MAG: fibronectin type III domain-containing protein [Cyanobacteriota bacterium]|nr:fibronectin type III domain-containing protein [Cyanobacteriota bacterium]
MAKFPRREAEIIALVQDAIDGFNANTEVYPAPVIPIAQMSETLNRYKTAQTAVIAAKAAAEQATTDKNEALEQLTDELKANLRYAEAAVQLDDDKLKLIGWGGRGSGSGPEVPGAPRNLEAARTGPSWAFLDWKRPADGGKAVVYKVQQFDPDRDLWQEVATAVESETMLFDLQPGKKLEYRVVAANKAGEGLPSNAIAIVL